MNLPETIQPGLVEVFVVMQSLSKSTENPVDSFEPSELFGFLPKREEDLQALIEFYQTPTGRKTIELMPQLFQESMQRTAQVLNPKIQGIMQEIIAEELQRIN